MPDKSCILVSYMPLLMPKGSLASINILETMSDKTHKDLLDSLGDNAHVEACLWTLDDKLKSATPVFVMKNAHAIAEHLEEWAENNVDKWFKLAFAENDGRYLVTLWPNLDESVARFKLRYLMEKEEFLEDMKYSLFFEPLRFISGVSDMFANVKPKIGSKASIGFLDIDHLNPDDFGNIDSDNIKEVGPFDTNFDGRPFDYDMSPYIDNQFDDAEVPIGKLKQWRNPNVNLEDFR